MSASDDTVGGEPSDGKFGEGMLQKSGCCRFMAATIQACLISVAMLISAVHYNVAQAKSRTAGAAACGHELKRQCRGVEVKANNMLECLQTSQVSGRCAALAHHVVRSCDRDAAQLCQGVVAGRGNILGCLTTARGAVSARCNAALSAAFLR